MKRILMIMQRKAYIPNCQILFQKIPEAAMYFSEKSENIHEK